MVLSKTRMIIAYVLLCLCAVCSGLHAQTHSTIEEKSPEAAFTANCGVLSLAYVMEQCGRTRSINMIRKMTPPGKRGFSIAELLQIAGERQFELTAVRLIPEASVGLPLPAIIHLPRSKDAPLDGHFCVLEAADETSITLFDPQTRNRAVMTIGDLAKIWQGIILAPSRRIPADSHPLDRSAIASVRGGHCPSHSQAGTSTGGGDYGWPDGSSSSGNTSGNGGIHGSNQCGTPVWNVNMINLNLTIRDIPLWYDPPVGPQVQIALVYNAQYPVSGTETIGRKWNLNYNSYLLENTEDGSVLVSMPGSRQELYTSDGSGGYTRGYKVFNTLEKLGTDHFRLTMPDDTVFIYQIPSGSGASHPVLVEWRDAWGQSLTFGYNTNARLITVTDPVGQVTAITYVDDRIDRVDDPFGRFAEFDYDAEGDLRRITDMGGYWTDLDYDHDGYITEMANEKGATSFYIEPSDSSTTTITYPAPGAAMQEHYRITVTDPKGGKSEYFYNGQSGYGWYVSPRHYMDYVDSSNNNYASGVPKIIYNYANTVKGDREEIDTITWQEGTLVGHTYDYDTGLLTGISDYDSNITAFDHNDMGRVTSATPPLGYPITYEYNTTNNVDLEHVVRQGLGTSNISYNAYHQVTRIEDVEGHIYGPITYDGYGRIDTITETFDSHSVVTDYTYYDPGVQGQYRLKEVLVDSQIVESYTYDAIGRVRTATDATGLTLTYDYNNLNHITRITYPDTRFIEYGYSSCCPRSIDYVTDRSGRTIYYAYDKLQRLESVYEPGVGFINYRYDANGNLERIIDANGRATRFEYDDEDRLYRKYDAEDRFVEYSYNNNGLLEKRTNTRGIETVFGYYEDHQLASITYSDSTPGETFTYDDYRRPDTVTDALGTHTYAFYDNSRLQSVDGPWTDDTIAYGYDNLNRIKTITPQGGRSRTTVYDDQGRLQNIIIDTATYSYGYQGVNPLVRSLTRPNGSQTTYDYTGLNQLEHLTNKNASETVLSKFDFVYNDQDLIGHETVTNAPGITGFTENLVSYDYNALNQLTSSTSPGRLYTYDDDGNMTGGFTPAGYAFTARYDANDRMTSIAYNDGSIDHRYEFGYGHDGLLGRVLRYENTVLTDDLRIVRDGFTAIQERDAGNAVTREYAWGLNKGGGIGGLLTLRQSSQDYDYLYDGKGNVSAVIDSTQAVVASYRYDSFGRLKTQSGSLDQPYQFSTKRYSAGSGLNYYGYRFYSSAIGRWMNRDPLGEEGGMNLYGFVKNIPINLIDPYGLWSISGILKNAKVRAVTSFGAAVLAEYGASKLGPGKLRGFLYATSAALAFFSANSSMRIGISSYVAAFTTAETGVGLIGGIAVGTGAFALMAYDVSLVNEYTQKAMEDFGYDSKTNENQCN